jgi:hypothetical protein
MQIPFSVETFRPIFYVATESELFPPIWSLAEVRLGRNTDGPAHVAANEVQATAEAWSMEENIKQGASSKISGVQPKPSL